MMRQARSSWNGTVRSLAGFPVILWMCLVGCALQNTGEDGSREAAPQQAENRAPGSEITGPGSVRLHLAAGERLPGFAPTRTGLFIAPEATVTANEIHEARVLTGPQGATYVQLILGPTGRRALYEVTAANRGRRLAMFIDDELVTAPVIYEPIDDGRCVINLPGERAREIADHIMGRSE